MSLLFLVLWVGAGEAEGAARPRAPAPDTIQSLLSEPAPQAPERGPGPAGLLFRMLGWVAALAVLTLAAVRIWRRLAPRAQRGLAGGGLSVVGRAALTPRHLIYAVRVGNQRLLVLGVSGDRIAALSELDDPAQLCALDPTFEKTLRSVEGPAGAEGPGGPVEGGDGLSPYRREVERLRGLVRGWRGRLARVPPAEAGSGPR